MNFNSLLLFLVAPLSVFAGFIPWFEPVWEKYGRTPAVLQRDSERALVPIMQPQTIPLEDNLEKFKKLSIILPQDGSYLNSNRYLIVKGGDSPSIDRLTIEFNGVTSDILDISSSEYKKDFKDYLILQAEYDQGKNTIIATGFKQGKIVSTSRSEIMYDKTNTYK